MQRHTVICREIQGNVGACREYRGIHRFTGKYRGIQDNKVKSTVKSVLLWERDRQGIKGIKVNRGVDMGCGGNFISIGCFP
jgi:hypothetical protein